MEEQEVNETLFKYIHTSKYTVRAGFVFVFVQAALRAVLSDERQQRSRVRVRKRWDRGERVEGYQERYDSDAIIHIKFKTPAERAKERRRKRQQFQ